MEPKDLRELSDEELSVKERELRESLFFLKVRQRTNQLESPARLRQTRRDVARVKTIRHARAVQKQG